MAKKITTSLLLTVPMNKEIREYAKKNKLSLGEALREFLRLGLAVRKAVTR